jgi:hypothetical protein
MNEILNYFNNLTTFIFTTIFLLVMNISIVVNILHKNGTIIVQYHTSK